MQAVGDLPGAELLLGLVDLGLHLLDLELQLLLVLPRRLQVAQLVGQLLLLLGHGLARVVELGLAGLQHAHDVRLELGAALLAHVQLAADQLDLGAHVGQLLLLHGVHGPQFGDLLVLLALHGLRLELQVVPLAHRLVVLHGAALLRLLLLQLLHGLLQPLVLLPDVLAHRRGVEYT